MIKIFHAWKADEKVHCRLVGIILLVSLVLSAVPARAASLLIGPEPEAKTPRHLGFNAEMLQFVDQSNLLDWMADSGASICRLMLPPTTISNQFEDIRSEADFQKFRDRLKLNPEGTIDWTTFRLTEKTSGSGNTEQTCGMLLAAGIEPLLDIPYTPKKFPESILVDLSKPVTENSNINWRAAAAAYQVYFGLFYKLGGIGVKYFMMPNEPEYDTKGYYYPEKLGLAPKMDERIPYVALQLGTIAKFGQLAKNDVQEISKGNPKFRGIFLSGPGAHSMWEAFWPAVSPYVDALDSHCYDPNGKLISWVQNRMALRSGKDRKLAFSEFNLISGAMTPANSMLTQGSALHLGGVLGSLLSSTSPTEPETEFAALYLFNYPATHRIYKSLVYGDMDVLDSTGFDQLYQNGVPEMAPHLESLQMRTATNSYFVFKMMARCVPGFDSKSSFYDVLPTGASTLGFSQAVDSRSSRSIYLSEEPEKYYANGGSGGEYQVTTVRTPDRLYTNILNPGPGTMKNMEISTELLPQKYKYAVVRELSELKRDEVVAVTEVKNDKVSIDVPGDSLTQVTFVDLDLSKIEHLELTEKTFTPGKADDLKKFQTTRLRALGTIDGKVVDLSELNIEWKSSLPQLVNVYSGGLVLRRYDSSREALITASVFNGGPSATTKIAPSLAPQQSPAAVPNATNVEQDKQIQEQVTKP